MCFDWFLSIQPIRGQTHRWRHRQQILFLYHIEKKYSLSSWVCAIGDHRRHRNVLRQRV